MSVLVDRLRKEAQHDEVEGGFAVALLREAADEIERLERNATAFCAEISGLIVRAGVPAFGYPQDGIRELGARIQRLEKQLAASLNDAKASTGLVPVGAKSITVKRGNGNSFLAWFTTEDGREISLAHCPLAANSEMEIALDSHNVILNTWPKDDDASTASPEVSVVADARRYRILRENGAAIFGEEKQVQVVPGQWVPAPVIRCRETLDQAVDAMLAAVDKEEKG
jgi:hypothetical protein